MISCLERRNVIAGIAFSRRSARYASIARESRCQNLSGFGVALLAVLGSSAGTTLMTLMMSQLLFIPSVTNVLLSAYEFEMVDSSAP
jgi:hypothetical protein